MLSTPCLMENTARMALLWSADALSVSRPRTSRSAGQCLASRHAGASLQRSAAGHRPSGGSSGIDGSVALELELFHDVYAQCGIAALSVSFVVSDAGCHDDAAGSATAPLPRSKWSPWTGSSASQALAYAAGRSRAQQGELGAAEWHGRLYAPGFHAFHLW